MVYSSKFSEIQHFKGYMYGKDYRHSAEIERNRCGLRNSRRTDCTQKVEGQDTSIWRTFLVTYKFENEMWKKEYRIVEGMEGIHVNEETVEALTF